MRHPRDNSEDRFREEFAFDLTPNVDAGAASRMHRHRSKAKDAASEGKRPKGQSDAAPDAVEPGPTVEGCHWRVT